MPNAKVEIVSRGEALEAQPGAGAGLRMKDFVEAINLIGDHSAGKLSLIDEDSQAIEKDLQSAARDLGKELIIERTTGENPQLYFRVRLREESTLLWWWKQLRGFLRGAKLLYLLASLLLAFAASMPIWISFVTDGAVIPVDPGAMIGLVSLMIATLGLVGALVYIKLRDEVHEQVRESIERPLDVSRLLGASYTLFREYSKSLHHKVSAKDEIDASSLTALIEAEKNARQALTICRLYLDLPEYRHMKLQAINHLAYFQAALHLHSPGEGRAQEAMRLADELRQEVGDYWEYWDTIAWVMVRCNDKKSPDYNKGIDLLQGLLSRGDIPEHNKVLLKEKYGTVL